MARNVKPGISFYRMDSGHIQNKKIRLLFNECGADGYYVWCCILDYAYGKWGYYFDMNDSEELELFASEYCKVKLQTVKKIIDVCLKRQLFNVDISKRWKVLTCSMMQEVFLIATKERRKKGSEFTMQSQWLLIELDLLNEDRGVTVIIPGNNTEIPGNNPQTRRDIKQHNTTEDTAPQAHIDPVSLFLISKFSEGFIPAWQQWKDYKLKEFKFSYKSEQSELAAITELFNLSEGKEVTATAIMQQSIANGWKGFFDLKNNHGTKIATVGSNQVLPAVQPAASLPANTKIPGEIKRLYSEYRENRVTVTSIDVQHFNYLKKQGRINFEDDHWETIKQCAVDFAIDKGREADESLISRFAVLEFFRVHHAAGNENIF